MYVKLTIFRAFAVLVLILGWSITPAHAHDCAKHQNSDHKHCNEPPSSGPATLTLNFGMLYDYPASSVAPPFTVRVGRDSPKKIGFNNTSFKLDLNYPLIMQFNVVPGTCVAQYGAVNEMEKILLGEELNNAEITEGYFEAEVDRKAKPKTGKVIVQYVSKTLGLVRIQLDGRLAPDPPEVFEVLVNPGPPRIDRFEFFSDYVVAWQVIGGSDDKIIYCPIDFQPYPAVELILTR